MIRLAIVAALMAPLTTATTAQAADAPAEIKLGTLYASSGRFASISMPVHDGLKLWIDQKNADGGVYVKAFDKKIPLKLVAYDDQSSTATAATLYNQLITQDLALVAPETREAHGCAEFPGLGLLLARNRQSALEIGFCFLPYPAGAT